MSNALSREAGLDHAIELLNALNQSTRARGTLRLHLPPDALAHVPTARNDVVWLGISYDYATQQEAEHAANVIQSVYSAYAESESTAQPPRLDVELHDAALVTWLIAQSTATLHTFIEALTRRLQAFE